MGSNWKFLDKGGEGQVATKMLSMMMVQNDNSWNYTIVHVQS